jgi:hypothetical protein
MHICIFTYYIFIDDVVDDVPLNKNKLKLKLRFNTFELLSFTGHPVATNNTKSV